MNGSVKAWNRDADTVSMGPSRVGSHDPGLRTQFPNDAVNDTAKWGNRPIMFATAVMVRGMMSDPTVHPVSYASKEVPAVPYCSRIVVVDPLTNGSPGWGNGVGTLEARAPPRYGSAGVGVTLSHAGGIRAAASAGPATPTRATRRHVRTAAATARRRPVTVTTPRMPGLTAPTGPWPGKCSATP